MAKQERSYAALMSEIERLRHLAEKVKQDEVQGVVSRVREAIVVYGLTPSDLFGAGARKNGKNGLNGHGLNGHAKPAKKSKSRRQVKYQDSAGNTWIGMGKRPNWIHDALAQGKSLEDFRV